MGTGASLRGYPVETESECRSHTVLVADDDRQVLESISMLLRACGYNVITSENAEEAIEKFPGSGAEVVLSDVRMPGLSGLELAEKIYDINPDVPVILMTAYAEVDVAVDAIHKGAFDFIIKPYKPDHLIRSVGKAARFFDMVMLEKNYKQTLEEEVRRKTKELTALNREIVHRLTVIAEFRDEATGLHISRIGYYAGKIAEALNMPGDFVDQITLASSLHDIGKVGIPDSIILKPGPLAQNELDTIKTHTTIGRKMLAGSSHPILNMAESIALNHHERWDGKGYPRGLKGEEAPVEARIVMLVDQYDALRSKRPYKTGFGHEKAFKVITEGDGRTMPEHFAPDLLNAFTRTAGVMDEIFNTYQGSPWL